MNSLSKFESLDNLKQLIKEKDVIAAQPSQVLHSFFGCTNFHYSIFDEASLAIEPLSLGPIMLAKKFIMVGDYYILNPTVKSMEAEKGGMSISLFRRLSEKYPYDVVVLKKQYRMNDHISNFTNAIAYRGLIK